MTADPDCCPPVWWCDGSGTAFSAAVGPKPGAAAHGPYYTEAEAVAACPGSGGGETVTVDCCPDDPIPLTIHATIVGGPFAATYPAAYEDESTIGWDLDNSSAPTMPDIPRLSCAGFGWLLTVGLDNFTPETESCDPFTLTFDITGSTITGAASITYTP